MAHPITKLFFSRRSRTEKAGLARFTKIFMEQVDQEKVNSLYKGYTRGLHEYRERNSQMTYF